MLTDEVKRLLGFREGLAIVVTIGNSLRGDDGAGPFIASKLCETQTMVVFDANTTPENYIGKIIELKPAHLLFIDAADFKGTAGEVRSIHKDQISDYALSTHMFPLRAVWEIIEQSIKVEIQLIGIQPLDISFRESLSIEVEQAANEIIEILNS